ncbi:uncharacterized protein ACN63O_021374 [Diretmus argenteus]
MHGSVPLQPVFQDGAQSHFFSWNGQSFLPSRLDGKLRDLGLSTPLRGWISDFLTDRPQTVKVAGQTSSTLCVSIGAPQGCVLSPLLYSLYTHDCVATHATNQVVKFADDTVVVGLVSGGDESAYREEIATLEQRCRDDNLSLHGKKTKEIVVDPRRKKDELQPITIDGTAVERVETFKYLGVNLTKDLSWDCHTTAVVKKAQQRLYGLRRLKKFGLKQNTIRDFYRGTIESLLTSSFTAWYGSCTDKNRKALRRVVRTAKNITGCELPSLEDLYTQRCLNKSRKIIEDPNHPHKRLFSPLRSRRVKGYKIPLARTSRLRNSFFPQAIRLLNDSTNTYMLNKPLRKIIDYFGHSEDEATAPLIQAMEAQRDALPMMTALRGYGGLHFSSACRVLIRDFDEIYPEWAKLAKIASVIPVSSGKMAEEEKKIPRARITMKPSDRPKAKDEDPTSPTSPFLSLNFELKKMEEEGKKGSSPSSSNECAASAEAKQGQKKDIEMITEMDKMEKKAEAHATTEGQAMDFVKDSAKSPPVSSAVSDNQATGSSPAKTAVPGVRPKGSVVDLNEDDDEVQGVKNATAAPPSTTQCPPQVISIPNIAPEEKCSTSGLKRTLSETMQRDVKRPKVDVLELEAERKITAKASSHLKLEKVVQQLVEERLRVLQLTVFDKDLQELKDRVDKIDCATKHQTALNTLQTKIARLAKTFGEANQVSENKRKQETAAAAAATTAATAAATAAKTAAAANTPPAQRPVRTSMEVKQTPTTFASMVPPAQSTPAPTSTAMVTQSSILQLITSSSKAVTTLATGITTQTPTGTLLLKTAAGSNMMGPGQPLLIQLPLSMTNGQTGTLVNFPVSSLSAANSLNKGKTSTTTTTYILKPAPIITVATSSSVADTVLALQASTGQMSPGQISLARVVYSGGTGGINTPKAGVSVTAARTPAQLVSVAGAMSSASSPATSGPAATGSTAPGPPQGTSMTSKTDNQATGSSPAKPAVPGVRPKGPVIDLTEDDDEVQGVKNATAVPPSTTQRPPQVISIPNIAGARSSPQSNLPTSSNPQLTVHHRPPLDSPIKSRAVSSTTPTRASTMSLPPLPSAPAPPGRLPPEAAQTSPPQQPQLKLVPRQTGIVLGWCVSETDRTCATVESYHLYAFHQDNSSSTNAAQQHWKKIGEVEALPLPMACALTRFQSGSTYHFAVRAKDIYGRFGSFCEPQCAMLP